MGLLHILKHFVATMTLLTTIHVLTPLASRYATQFLPSVLSRRTMSTFRLDPSIFNRTLYKQVTDIWLPGIDLRGEELDFSVMKQWFLASPEERITFDRVCRANFAHALDAIGPEAMPTPTPQPFIDEIKRITAEEPANESSEASWAALAMILLLDQIPRNIFRTNEGLRKVYKHYDHIAYGLSRSLLSPSSGIPRVDAHPQWRDSAVHRLWFYMPLMHSEDIESHKFLDEIMNEYAQYVEKLENHKATKEFLEAQFQAEKDHRIILDRFGRYPHRNEALGRATTEEEKKFLSEGGATFGVAQEKST